MYMLWRNACESACLLNYCCSCFKHDSETVMYSGGLNIIVPERSMVGDTPRWLALRGDNVR